MKDWGWAVGLVKPCEEGLAVRKEMEAKRKSKDAIEPSELLLACWYQEFRQEYMVETDRFIAFFIGWATLHFRAILPNKYLADHGTDMVGKV